MFLLQLSHCFTTSIYEREKCATNLNGIGDMMSKNSSETIMNIKIINIDKAIKKTNLFRSYQFQIRRKAKDMMGYITLKNNFILEMSYF